MRVHLLGTGSADGWPNPFCRCASCTAERTDGHARTPSSALVDASVLIDCGPTTPHLPAGSGLTLADVEHVLLTHGHPDHLQPAFLLSRSWTPQHRTLHVWGPTLAIDACRMWLGPDACVELHVVQTGDVCELPTGHGRYTAHAIRASHAHGDGDAMAQEALLYVVEDERGRRLLYATDTGPLPAATIAGIGRRVDIAFVDETFGDKTDHATGHLDLQRLPGFLADLRAAGVIDDATHVGATHLSHHNPPSRVLRGRLADLGVRLQFDGDAVDTERSAGRTLILGGARSGKSTRAEAMADGHAEVTYIATGGRRDDDGEWLERVARHQARRPAHWRTLETVELPEALRAASAGSIVIIDCLALWLTAALDAIDAWRRIGAGTRTELVAVTHEASTAIDQLADAVAACRAEVVVVSNEVGMGIVPDSASGRLFRDLLGVANARIADACDDVVLVVAGRAIPLQKDGTHR